MSLRSHIVTMGICLLMGAAVLYLIRVRRLREQYALIWLGVCTAMIVLALWRSLLDWIAEALGIYYAPSALFLLGMGFSFVLLMHFSVVMTRLHRDNARLAVRMARMGLSTADGGNGTPGDKCRLFDQEAEPEMRPATLYVMDPRD